MKIILQLCENMQSERQAMVRISASELAAVYLHLAHPEDRNRTDRYMRRHPCRPREDIDPNKPVRSPNEPAKLSVPSHIREMVRVGMIPSASDPIENINGEVYSLEPAMFVVPISDLVANLLRPCFHSSGLGRHRLFHFTHEPIDQRDYFCACFFQTPAEAGHIKLRWVHFDAANDRALDPNTGQDLIDKGLIWAAGLVPLVMDAKPLSPVEIAQNDYDLRQLLGRTAQGPIRDVYEGWFDQWDQRVAEAVTQHEGKQKPFATFYHSILALDKEGNIHIRQEEGTLPELAKTIAAEGMTDAGLLDSGGSCALYDVWMASYLNHSWYFREPRGAILVFQLKTTLRIPLDQKTWISRRK